MNLINNARSRQHGAGILYTPNDYLREIAISRQKRLLVEGQDDKEIFRRLLNQLYPKEASRVVIDTAEQLRGYDPPVGNREKVERICIDASAKFASDKLVGFVDREFRNFLREPELRDEQPEHVCDGLIVRSRGHSVENYLFDFALFKRRVSVYVSGVQSEAVVSLFENVFQDAIRIACTLGLTGTSLDPVQLECMRKSLHWSKLDITSARLKLDVTRWAELLKQYYGEEFASEAKKWYDQWWDAVIRADDVVVRWNCHGHIGLHTIWACFQRCVYESFSDLTADERKKKANMALPNDHEYRFRDIVDQWVELALGSQVECPKLIFDMLGISNAPG